MVIDKFQKRRQTPPMIFSGFERTNHIKHKHGHIAKEKSELKIIKSGAYDAKMPVFLWNKSWRRIRKGRGQPTSQKWESALEGFKESGQNYWRQHLRKYVSCWSKERNHAWEGRAEIGNQKRKTDAWVELCGGICIRRTVVKAKYKSTPKQLVGAPGFIFDRV